VFQCTSAATTFPRSQEWSTLVSKKSHSDGKAKRDVLLRRERTAYSGQFAITSSVTSESSNLTSAATASAATATALAHLETNQIRDHESVSSSLEMPYSQLEGDEKEVHRQICSSMSDITTGQWNSEGLWVPTHCQMHIFNTAQTRECLSKRNLIFSGDSLLRNIASSLTNLIGVNASSWPSWGQRDTEYLLGRARVDSADFSVWWTPSAFFQTPAQTGAKLGMTRSVVVLSVGVWDMGEYFRGVDAWRKGIESFLRATLEQMRADSDIWVLQIHKLWPNRCNQSLPRHKLDLCVNSNSDERSHLFRDALSDAVACVAVESPKKQRIRMFSTFGMTNTAFAQGDGEDAVHYGKRTTDMEAQLLLNAICFDEQPNARSYFVGEEFGICKNVGLPDPMVSAAQLELDVQKVARVDAMQTAAARTATAGDMTAHTYESWLRKDP
jgi:hypothetical protein